MKIFLGQATEVPITATEQFALLLAITPLGILLASDLRLIRSFVSVSPVLDQSGYFK